METLNQDLKSYTVETKLTLTEKEEQIFQTLMEVVQEHKLKTTLRVAGGWVRDKIMGKSSTDIDIALDDMFGEDFVKLLNEKLYPDGAKKFGVIKSNSEMSKHLATATIRVNGMFIDLVNLRSEKYTDQSRVPIIEIGSPEEDAYRRDLTINTMFYNINKQEVEDFTKLGLYDLQHGIIRTPLEPLRTFLDDPLRVLRTVRFATRFDFKIVPEIFEAVQDPGVREALVQKVSYERLGKEMDLMLADRFPFNSVKYLYDFGIIQLLYKFPDNCKELKDEQLVSKLIYESLKISQVLGCQFLTIRQTQVDGLSSYCSRNFNLGQDEKSIEAFKEFQKITFYTALLLPFLPYEYKAKNKLEKVIQKVMYDSLKKSNDNIKYVMSSIVYINQAIEVVNKVFLNKGLGDLKLEVGHFLREAGHKWDTIFMLAIAQEYFNTYYKDQAKGDLSQCKSEFDVDEALVNELLVKYSHFNEVIHKEKLDDIHLVKPLLDGKQVCDLYGIKPGKALKFLLDEEIKYQILNPEAKYDEVSKHLETNKKTFLDQYS